MSNSKGKIEVYNRVNRLKLKAGLSHTDPNAKLRIDPSTVNKADSIIEKKAEAYVYGARCKTDWKQKARGKKEPGR